MVVDFSKIDSTESPVLILKNMSGTPIGVLGAAFNLSPDIKYNEASVIEFNIPQTVDGEFMPYYDKVVGMRIVELQNVGQFILVNPTETNSGGKTIKNCKAYSLEFEFTFKKITVEKGTYNFWNPTSPDDTILGIILSYMPSWSVGHIDDTLIGKYRTFETSGENIYNFIKNTLQTSYNCVFDFDTFTRKINVRDASGLTMTNPVFISSRNLAKEIKVSEDTENIITQIEVNGAEGVNIRDVNPTGTNKIINLDYYMTEDNFSADLIDKYYEWKTVYEENRLPYYNLSIDYSLQVMRKTTEEAALVDIKSDLTSVENRQAVTIQAIAQGLTQQSELDAINAELSIITKKVEAKLNEIAEIEERVSEIYEELVAITKKTNFKSYFTDQELIVLDRYIKEDAISESSFVASEIEMYSDANIGSKLSDDTVAVNNAKIELSPGYSGKSIYRISGGRLRVGEIESEIINSVCEVNPDKTFVMTAYLGSGKTNEGTFNTACISITGQTDEVDNLATSLNINCSTGFMYFTYNTSEYERRAVAWELYEFGEDVLSKLSQPTYTFSITSNNFLNLEDFVSFKNSIKHGEKVYVEIEEGKVLTPIVIGTKFSYESPNSLTLEFSDSYKSSDSSFRIADLLNESISMGKKVDVSKFTYSAFIDSGANTKVKEFMSSAFDVSKNEIVATKNQAITWGDSGIRLRKWSDNSQSQYDPHQLWLNNNSVLMTSNNWATAELAIGHFVDKNLGDLFGIVAPNLVGTLIAGGSLIIESAKNDGGTAVFRVDADGCKIHNSELSITNNATSTHIILDALHGIAIGTYPLIKEDGDIDKSKCKFWVDDDGNLFFSGTLMQADGDFVGTMAGTMSADGGYIGGVEGWLIEDSAIYNKKADFNNSELGIYIGTDGIALGDGSSYIKASQNGLFEANNVRISGGAIGDWSINSEGGLSSTDGDLTTTLSGSGVSIYNKTTLSTQRIGWEDVVSPQTGSNSSDSSLTSRISVVESDNSGVATLNSDTYYVLGEVDELDLSLVSNNDGFLHRYYFEFTPSSSFSGVSITPEVAWSNWAEPISGHTYQATITRGIGVLVGANT